ncbi:MAG: hypothetical protein ACTHQQ_13670, partial [Solirubrobacteraceae bacterium]
MTTVSELSDPYANFMFGPRSGDAVCTVCFNLTRGFERCYSCARGARTRAAVVPKTNTVGGEKNHQARKGDKRRNGEKA